MSLKRFTFGDIFPSDLLWDNTPTWTSISVRGEPYRSDEFDLVPKKRHYERRLKEREQELSHAEGIQKHHEAWIAALKKEIDELKDQIGKK